MTKTNFQKVFTRKNEISGLEEVETDGNYLRDIQAYITELKDKMRNLDVTKRKARQYLKLDTESAVSNLLIR